jgi:hypothetical protein
MLYIVSTNINAVTNALNARFIAYTVNSTGVIKCNKPALALNALLRAKLHAVAMPYKNKHFIVYL